MPTDPGLAAGHWPFKGSPSFMARFLLRHPSVHTAQGNKPEHIYRTFGAHTCDYFHSSTRDRALPDPPGSRSENPAYIAAVGLGLVQAQTQGWCRALGGVCCHGNHPVRGGAGTRESSGRPALGGSQLLPFAPSVVLAMPVSLFLPKKARHPAASWATPFLIKHFQHIRCPAHFAPSE